MKKIIAINSNTYHGFSLAEAVAGIKKAGFEYIELTATKGWTEHVFPTMSFRELYRIKDQLEEAGLTPISLSGHTNLMDDQRLNDFIANIRLAAFFESKYIISSIGEAHLENQAEAADEQVAQNIKNLIPYLEEYDLILGLENHGKHATGKHLKEIVELIDSKRVVVNYDTANAIFYGDVDLANDLKTAVDQIGHIHLKDKAGAQDEWNFPAVGQGELNFKEIFEILAANNNEAPLSIEIEFTEAGPADLEEVNQAVQDSYKYLKELGIDF
ncbi:sugar phosphate isomerase/epimerase family protein [Halanaerobium congolense]|uniref:sugar phosphate isomerase/epimerase family protein n=1 Tax=Halanaerobium congolense TaxID=54121 RepID=UPI000883249D|nr:sugar phosphate isomerase/epimerase family protein [Halanaerobium congolense]SDH47963.1 Sugar phosphate isomerase/epimerase [Halanaerobium congolense]SHM40606.1 Sugar phosphate isomerase/epimerase [Halanaerobium congolense]